MLERQFLRFSADTTTETTLSQTSCDPQFQPGSWLNGGDKSCNRLNLADSVSHKKLEHLGASENIQRKIAEADVKLHLKEESIQVNMTLSTP